MRPPKATSHTLAVSWSSSTGGSFSLGSLGPWVDDRPASRWCSEVSLWMKLGGPTSSLIRLGRHRHAHSRQWRACVDSEVAGLTASFLKDAMLVDSVGERTAWPRRAKVAIQPVNPWHGHGGCKEAGGNDSATHIHETKLNVGKCHWMGIRMAQKCQGIGPKPAPMII